MRLLLEYLNSLPVAEQSSFAQRCGTTVGYLRKAVSVGQLLKVVVCVAIERETRRIASERGDPSLVVTCEELRPDVAWEVLRLQAAPATEREAA